LRTWLLAGLAPNGFRAGFPPVPATKKRMPFSASLFPLGRCGANRSLAVGVTGEDHIGPTVVQDVPERSHRICLHVPSGSEQRMVEVRQGTTPDSPR